MDTVAQWPASVVVDPIACSNWSGLRLYKNVSFFFLFTQDMMRLEKWSMTPLKEWNWYTVTVRDEIFFSNKTVCHVLPLDQKRNRRRCLRSQLFIVQKGRLKLGCYDHSNFITTHYRDIEAKLRCFTTYTCKLEANEIGEYVNFVCCADYTNEVKANSVA